MAIYGAGSVWDGEEVCDQFFAEGCFIVGWDRLTGSDLQSSLASLKIGDIIYLKANRPGSRTLRVKGVGIVSRSFIECLQMGDYHWHLCWGDSQSGRRRGGTAVSASCEHIIEVGMRSEISRKLAPTTGIRAFALPQISCHFFHRWLF